MLCRRREDKIPLPNVLTILPAPIAIDISYTKHYLNTLLTTVDDRGQYSSTLGLRKKMRSCIQYQIFDKILVLSK